MLRSIGFSWLVFSGILMACGGGLVDPNSNSGQRSSSLTSEWPAQLSIRDIFVDGEGDLEFNYEVWLYDPTNNSETQFLYNQELKEIQFNDLGPFRTVELDRMALTPFQRIMQNGQYLGARLGYRVRGDTNWMFGDPVWVPFTSDLNWFKTHWFQDRVPSAYVYDSKGEKIARVESSLEPWCAPMPSTGQLPSEPIGVAFELTAITFNNWIGGSSWIIQFGGFETSQGSNFSFGFDTIVVPIDNVQRGKQYQIPKNQFRLLRTDSKLYGLSTYGENCSAIKTVENFWGNNELVCDGTRWAFVSSDNDLTGPTTIFDRYGVNQGQYWQGTSLTDEELTKEVTYRYDYKDSLGLNWFTAEYERRPICKDYFIKKDE